MMKSETRTSEPTEAMMGRYFTLHHQKVLSLLKQLAQEGNRDAAELLGVATRRFAADAKQAELELRIHDAGRFYCTVLRFDSANVSARNALDRLIRPALTGLRLAHQELNRDQVIRHAEEVIAIDVDCFEAWMTMGRTYLLDGWFAEAVSCFARAVCIDASDSWAWINYARSLDGSDNWQAALDAYRKVIAVGGTTDTTRVSECERAISALYAKALFACRDAVAQADLQTAWKHFRVAHAIDHGNDQVAVLKRQLLSEMKARIRALWQEGSADLTEACSDYLDHDPSDLQVRIILARTLMNQRRFDEAKPVWKQLVDQQRDDPHLHLQIARCCNWLKERAEGLAAVREVLRLDPDQAEIRTIQRQLEALPPG